MNFPIFRKELRYRAGGLLALPVLLVAGWWGVHQTALVQRAGAYESLLAAYFAVPVTMICAAAGLACGLWQMLGETGQASWAFLRHRPVSVSRLFFGKLGAALLVYLLVTGVPLAGVIVWTKDPGHFIGPWLWPMAIPSLVDLLCGTVYVLAGMLIGLREARWFGSRLLPLGLALVCSAFTWFPVLWVALLAICTAWLILLPAAYSAMACRGCENCQRWPARLLTAITLTPAMLAIPGAIGGLTAELGRPAAPTGQTWEYYVQIGANLYKLSSLSWGRDDRYTPVVNDRGLLLTNAPQEKVLRRCSGVSLVLDWRIAGAGNESYRDIGRFLLDENYRRPVPVANERWYYLRNQNLLAGYSLSEFGRSHLIGYVGANGFTSKPAEAAPFHPVEDLPWWTLGSDLVVQPESVFAFDSLKRQCDEVFVTPRGERAVTARPWDLRHDDAENSRTLWVVATDKAVYVVDEHQKILLRQARLGQDYPVVGIDADNNLKTFGLLYSHDQSPWIHPKVFIRVAADGAVLSRTEVPALPYPAPEEGMLDAIAKGVYLPPVLLVMAEICDPPQPRPFRPWLDLVPMATCAAVSALLVFWLLRRYSIRSRWIALWMALGALLGLGGVLLMLAVRQWPPRVRCGHCGRKSVTSAFACAHCGQEFPVPAAGPVGIFDGAGEAPMPVSA